MTLSFRFGTVGSPIETPRKPGGSVGAVEYSRSIGLDALELGWVRSVRVSEASCSQICETARVQDVKISVHAPYYINLNADDEEWPNSRRRLMDAAYFGALAGATDIVFHPGSYFENAPEVVLPQAIRRLEGCVQELRGRGVQVRLRPETMGKAAMLGSLDDTLQMSAAVEGVEPCIDFAHLYARSGDGTANHIAAWLTVLEVYERRLGSESLSRLHIHLSGIDYGPRGEKEHRPVAESAFDLDAVLQALYQGGCAGRILCESPEMEKDALVIRRRWQEISGQP